MTMTKKMMKRMACGLLAVFMCISLAACGKPDDPASNAVGQTATGTDKAIVWTLGTTDPDPENSSMNAFAHATATFCDLVNERSGGRLVIKPYYNSVLGGDVQMFSDIREGNLDVYHGNPMASIDARLGFRCLPYLISDYDQAHELISNPDGELFQLLKEIIADQNAYALACGEGVFRGVINSKKPVRTIDDMKTLTFRVYEDPIVSMFWSSLSNTTIISWSDCYTALQTGVADGLESAANICVAMKFDEVAKYYTDLDWQWMGEVFMVNQDRWNELDSELQEIVQQAAWDAVAVEAEKGAEYRAEAYDVLKEDGVEVTLLTDEERQAWIDYGRSCYDEMRDVIGNDVYERVMEIVGLN